MYLWKRVARTALLLVIFTSLVACGSGQSLFGSTPTVYDLTQRPAEFANKDVTVQGYYLWKPGDPAISVLIPGLSTADGVRDAQPIYASVECNADGACQPSTTAIGEPSTGSIWLEGFPAEVTADLHTPGDSVWGVVEVTGRFETGGGFGPDGSYRYRLQVNGAKALQKVERIVSTLPDTPAPGTTPFLDLVASPEQYAGTTVTTQAYYFWSPRTSGILAESVSREKTPEDAAGLDPMPMGKAIALDGFPPDLSAQINVGENNSYVWGLVEVTGTFETGGPWGPNGEYQQHLTITDGQVRILEPAATPTE
jgi:hypothetical protein